jgi:hypothetical protein
MPSDVRIVVVTLAASVVSSIVLVVAMSASCASGTPAMPSKGAPAHHR